MKKFKLSVAIVMIGTLVSKALGLVREILLASKYGTGVISDSFIVSLNIPTVLISAVAGAILTNYITVYADAEKNGKETASKFNGNLIGVSFIISTVIVLIFMIFTKPIAKLFAAGFGDEELEYLIVLSRITIFCMYFIICAHIFKGFLEYKGKFLGTSLYGILMNTGMIAGIIFSTTENYQILGFGVIAGYALGFILLSIFAKKNDFQIKFNVNVKEEHFKKLVILTLPILLNDAVWQINGIVDKSIASTVGEGYISAINYSHYIVDMISSVFATSLVTVFFPNIVKIFKTKGIEEVKDKTRIILKFVAFIAIPCTVLIAIYSKSIVRVLLFRGAFTEESLNITSTAVSIYCIALLFVCMKTILFKVFYALQDTKSPTKSAIISILINIVLTLILVNFFGYIGIMVATIIASIISTILLFSMFKKKNGSLLNKALYLNFLKILIASIFMIGIIIVTNIFTNELYIINDLITIIAKALIGGLCGGILYIIILYIIKFDFKLKEL